MTKRPNPIVLSGGLRRWLPTACFALMVVSAGLVMPQMLPNAAAVPDKAPVHDNGSKDLWAYNPPPLPEGPDARAMLARLGVATVIVVGLCVGTLWLGKRWLRVKPVPAGGDRQLGVVEALPLNNRCWIYLLKVGTRQMVAGVDGSGLKALVSLTEPFEQALNEVQAGEAFGPPAP